MGTHLNGESVDSPGHFRESICNLFDQGFDRVEVQYKRNYTPGEAVPTRIGKRDQAAHVQGTSVLSVSSSDRRSWRSMSTNMSPNRAGLPNRALHNRKAAEFSSHFLLMQPV